MQDIDSPPPSLNDFPTDPVSNYDPFVWGGITLALVVLVAVAIWLFKRAEHRASGGAAIDARAKAVMKFLSPSAKAAERDQVQTAINSRKAVEEQFGATLKLSQFLNKISGELNSAVEGTEKKAYAPNGGNAPAQMSGGTYINIMVGADGKPVTAAPTPAPAAKPEKVPMSPDEHKAAIWFAVQKLFDYWKNLNVVTEAYRAAQRQLDETPPWHPPEEDARHAPPLSRKS
jgi:hypothetical protein